MSFKGVRHALFTNVAAFNSSNPLAIQEAHLNG